MRNNERREMCIDFTRHDHPTAAQPSMCNENCPERRHRPEAFVRTRIAEQELSHGSYRSGRGVNRTPLSSYGQGVRLNAAVNKPVGSLPIRLDVVM